MSCFFFAAFATSALGRMSQGQYARGVELRDVFPTRMKREGSRGHGLRKRDSVASTERRREGKTVHG